MPDDGVAIWRHYWSLRRGQALTYQEIAAYSHLCAWPLQPWEVEALMAMDAAVEAQIKEAHNNG